MELGQRGHGGKVRESGLLIGFERSMYIIGGIPGELACDARSFDIDHGDGNIFRHAGSPAVQARRPMEKGRALGAAGVRESRLEKA